MRFCDTFRCHCLWALFGTVAVAFDLLAQTTKPPTEALLAGITARGGQLASYDFAAWHASDSIGNRIPSLKGLGLFVGHRTGGKWTLAFGEMNGARDTFLIYFRATATQDSSRFAVETFNLPIPALSADLIRARALAKGIIDFGNPSRPYNAAVIPADSGRFWVYLYPAVVTSGVWPLGGDVRYLVSADGNTILQRRQLHRSIIEGAPPRGAAHGMHTAILDDVPEDTDVFYVLTRRPPLDELVITERYIYTIHLDGSITWVNRNQ